MVIVVVDDHERSAEPVADWLAAHFAPTAVVLLSSRRDVLDQIEKLAPRVLVTFESSDSPELRRWAQEARQRVPELGVVVVLAGFAPCPTSGRYGCASVPGVFVTRQPIEVSLLECAVQSALEVGRPNSAVGLGVAKRPPLLDLLHALHYGRRSLCVSLVRGRESGEIHFERGQIVHARTDESRGERALVELLTWSDASVETEAFDPSTERTIDTDFSTLILDRFRIFDEGTGVISGRTPTPATRGR